MAGQEARVPIQSEVDIVAARQKGRTLAAALGFSPSEATLIATAISELARNIVLYAGRGEIQLSTVENNGRVGIAIVAGDEGPGIANVRQALTDGYSTSGGLGVGLPGVKRLMDEFEISPNSGKGAIVKVKKWRL